MVYFISMTRKKLIAGNWKMHGSLQQNEIFFKDLLSMSENLSKKYNDFYNHLELSLFVPSLYLFQAQNFLANSAISFGTQNVSNQAENGAFTGEISAKMLKDFAAKYTIIGHSERRQLLGETDEFIAEKFFILQQNDIIPILCIGETQKEYEESRGIAVILQQLNAIFANPKFDKNNANFVIAYEPIWAIGSGLAATPEQVQTTHLAIRKRLQELNADLAEKVKILYGGSVKPENSKQLLNLPNVDGALIGGASLKANSFLAIAESIF